MTDLLQETEKTIREKSAVMLYFYNDNCAPCLSLRPKVEEMVQRYFPEIEFKLINSEGNEALTSRYGVFSNPTILVFFEAQEYKRFSKYISIQEMAEAISRPYDMIFE